MAQLCQEFEIVIGRAGKVAFIFGGIKVEIDRTGILQSEGVGNNIGVLAKKIQQGVAGQHNFVRLRFFAFGKPAKQGVVIDGA